MKSISFFFLIIINVSITAQWEWQNPVPQGNSLTSVFFMDDLNGCAVGTNGTVLLSSDGGDSWKYINLELAADLKSVCFTDETNCWIVGSDGVILKSTDSGNHWLQLPKFTTINLNCIKFIDPLHGWIVGSSGKIYNTTDGGINWSVQVSGVSANLNSIFAIGADTFWVCGSQGTILYSTNSGSTWNSKTTTIDKSLACVFFTQNGKGFISGEDGVILKSNDWGNTWQISYIAATTYTFNSIFFTDDYTGWIAAYGRFLLKTTTGGLVWDYIDLGINVELSCITFSGNSKSWIVGDGGTIVSTDNSWQSWEMNYKNYVRKWLQKIYFLTDKKGWACGSDAIYKTTTGGSIWERIWLDLTKVHKDVYFVDDAYGWAVGRFMGDILKTSNGGLTWQTIDPPGTGNFNVVWFYNRNVGWIGGQGGVLLKTTDGGLSWLPQNLDSATEIGSISFINDTTGWVLCAKNLYKTTDGGVIWKRFNFPDYFFSSISFANQNLGCVVGWNSIVLITTDGGDNWERKFLDNQNVYLESVSFTKDSNIVAVGLSHTIYRSTDAGETWSRQYSPSKTDLFSVYCLNKNEGWIAGDNGTILHTKKQSVTSTYFNSFVLSDFNVYQNYPNPFNPITTIKFILPAEQAVEIKIFDVLGNEVAVIMNEIRSTGENFIQFDATKYNLASGIYLYQLKTPTIIQTNKMLLLK